MKTILILEDDASLSALLQESLTQQGYAVRAFHDAQSAYNFLTSEHCDLMLVDIIIKDVNRIVSQGGVTFIWRAKEIAQQSGKALPIIAMSGSFMNKGMHNILDIAKQIGADEVLKKPFAPDELNRLIAKLLDD